MAFTAAAANDYLKDEDPLTDRDPIAGVTVEVIADTPETVDWFAAEHAVLLAQVRLTAQRAFDRHTGLLARALSHYLYYRGYRAEWVETQQLALAAAHRRVDRRAAGSARVALASALFRPDGSRRAEITSWTALEIYEEDGNLIAQGRIHHNPRLPLLITRRPPPVRRPMQRGSRHLGTAR